MLVSIPIDLPIINLEYFEQGIYYLPFTILLHLLLSLIIKCVNRNHRANHVDLEDIPFLMSFYSSSFYG